METIKKYLCPLASNQELMFGLQVAKTFKLNPLKREIYFVKYKESEPMQILTGYEVYLKRAQRSGRYAGMRSWTEGSLKDENLKGCVEVTVKGWDKPLQHEADYAEYVQKKKIWADGKVIREEPNRFWREKPKTMIKKVAISQAFRMAFPDEFDGMPYTRDEVIDVEAVESKSLPDVVEMPKLKAEAPKTPVETPQKPVEAVKTEETKVSATEPQTPVKSDPSEENEYLIDTLSDKSLEKLGKAKKFLGKKFEYVLKSLDIKDEIEIKTDEMADKVYSAAYKLYKSEVKK
jgi:phage recombination protein Bet